MINQCLRLQRSLILEPENGLFKVEIEEFKEQYKPRFEKGQNMKIFLNLDELENLRNCIDELIEKSKNSFK